MVYNMMLRHAVYAHQEQASGRSVRQILRQQDDDEREDGHGCVLQGLGVAFVVHPLQAVPIERDERYVYHHRDECGQRYHAQQFGAVCEQDDEHHAGDEGGESSAPSGFHVGHRLAYHGAAGHCADGSACGVGYPLCNAFGCVVSFGVGHAVDEFQGQGCLQQSDERQGQGGGKDDRQGIGIGQKGRDGEVRPPCGYVPQVGDHDDRSVRSDDEVYDSHDGDGHESGRDGFGDAGEQQDDGQSDDDVGCHHDHPLGRIHGVVGYAGQLGHEDDRRQTVHETHHDGFGDAFEQTSYPHHAQGDLYQACDEHGAEEVIQTVGGDQRGGDHRHGTGSRRYHRGSSADERDDEEEGNGCVQPKYGIDAGHDGESYDLRYDGEGRYHACRYVASDVGEPFLSVLCFHPGHRAVRGFRYMVFSGEGFNCVKIH